MPTKIQKGLFVCLILPASVFGQSTSSSVKHSPRQAKSQRKQPITVQTGIASYYANKFEGRLTFTDEVFHQDSLTAASNTLPMHTWVRVTNLRNQRTVIVRINDKMHPRNRRLIDLSRAAAIQLGFAGRGLTRVRVDVVGHAGWRPKTEDLRIKKPAEDTAGVPIQNDH